MVQEKRIVFDLTDITMVRHRCSKCKGEVTHRLSADDKIPMQCPLCKLGWDLSMDLLERHIRVLQDMRWLLAIKSPLVELKFEIDGKVSSETP